jgi:protein-tyrosine phosphatase
VTGKASVLFVCLGNICRSPLAEAAFRTECVRRGLDIAVDSAGIGDWHEGQAPDPRARAAAKRHGIDIDGYRARQVRQEDFTRFDLILALDRENFADLNRLRPADATASVRMLLDFVPGSEGKAVPDPYYGGAREFELVWSKVCQAARGLADSLAAEK